MGTPDASRTRTAIEQDVLDMVGMRKQMKNTGAELISKDIAVKLATFEKEREGIAPCLGPRSERQGRRLSNPRSRRGDSRPHHGFASSG